MFCNPKAQFGLEKVVNGVKLETEIRIEKKLVSVTNYHIL